MPLATISSMSVCAWKNGSTTVSPPRTKTSAEISSSSTPFVAARRTPFSSFAPSARESTALRPTPRPAATAIIRFCTGKAMLSAASAFSLMRATNIESTTLYSACTSMESIIGRLMLASSLPTGMTPILFSVFCSIFFSLRPAKKPNNKGLLYYASASLSRRILKRLLLPFSSLSLIERKRAPERLRSSPEPSQ